MAVPTLLVTGPVGVGKTSVAFEMLEVLEERELAHVFFDVDGLTYFHPKLINDPFGGAVITVVRLTAPLAASRGEFTAAKSAQASSGTRGAPLSSMRTGALRQ